MLILTVIQVILYATKRNNVNTEYIRKVYKLGYYKGSDAESDFCKGDTTDWFSRMHQDSIWFDKNFLIK